MVNYYGIYEKMIFVFFSNSKIFRRGEAFLCMGTGNSATSVTKGFPIVMGCCQAVDFRHKSSSRRRKIFDSEIFEKIIFSYMS